MIRNHPLLFTILALALTITVSAWLAVLTRPEAPVSFAGAADEAAPPFEAISLPGGEGEEYGYLLREHEGKLAVFEKGQDTPHMVFDIYVSTLPDYDQGQLAQGVKVKDYDELVLLIEDYIS